MPQTTTNPEPQARRPGEICAIAYVKVTLRELEALGVIEFPDGRGVDGRADDERFALVIRRERTE